MDFVRIGEKLISLNKIDEMMTEILTMRGNGYSQSEVSKRLQIDRAFISRLEKMGEMRTGGRIAVIGFPVENTDELLEVCAKKGVEFTLLMNEEERWRWIKQQSGEELLNKIMELTHQVRMYDLIIVLGSNYRINLIKALLNKEIIGIKLGESPIEKDVYLSPDRLEHVIEQLIPKK